MGDCLRVSARERATQLANAATVSIDLGFAGASSLDNNETTTAAVSGSSSRAVCKFNNNNRPPKFFMVTQEVTFPEGAHVTITGGGPNDNVIEATDATGNRAIWHVVGR
ncbi:hypothetical protein F5Y00DRAFT_263374 [Daldinia vernicosa]|uniref:uncharacterized protein n=1 Tax=Daldinia vernicosa TaxID=114800 RepID=UPI0020073B51|nr:uncharacterized protein F5Y00DRAFT_263374 [Daldinia vernicosa]KAI0847693.1 hypothetical protein F5Y00DRAFT_263374 [Daldinia vernicosa]